MEETVWRKPQPCYQAVLSLNLPPEAAFMYRSANNMVPLASSSSLFAPPAFDGEYFSEDVIVVGDENSKQFVLAGALTAFRSLSYFSLVKRGRFHSILLKQPNIRPDEEPEKVVVLTGDDWRLLLQRYADLSARAMQVAPIRAAENVTGYCTWYYYYADVTERDLLDNLAALGDEQKRAEYPAQYVQIDDGYQTFQGDWLDQDSSWPTPLAEIGKRIRGAGMTGGIWLMPFLASSASRIFREHPDWFVQDIRNQPLVFNGWSPPPDNYWACLDATQPQVQAHLQNVFRTFRNWGFTLFKLDGLGFALPDGRRRDPDSTPVSAFRQGMQAIREAVPDCTLLGCGAPFMPCLGFVDHCRVSPDTARCWEPQHQPNNSVVNTGAPSIVNALHSTLTNWWMIDRWFRADPDVLMARQDNAFYTVGEARLSVLTGILTGISVTSDNLNTIAPDRLALLKKAVHFRLHEPCPHQWKPDSWPQVFLGTCRGRRAAAIFNDSNEAMQYSLAELGFAHTANEVLQDLGRIAGTLTLPPHDAALLIE